MASLNLGRRHHREHVCIVTGAHKTIENRRHLIPPVLWPERRMPHHTERRNSTVLDTGTGRVSGTYNVV